MTEKLYNVLFERYSKKKSDIPWFFWHRYRSTKANEIIVAPFQDRKKFMKTLCMKANVPYFRVHPLRHAGASLMDSSNVPIGLIQKILGHENRKTTEIYITPQEGDSKKAVLINEEARNKYK